MLHFAEGLSETAHLKSEISDLKSLAESRSRQIRAWADTLQNSAIRGPRHLNDQTRQQYDREKSADAFRADLAQHLHQAFPKIYPAPPART